MNSLRIVEDLRKRTFKSLIETFILAELNDDPLSGYDVNGLIHKRFDVVVSPGTIYSLLYSLERDGLIKGAQERNRRVYTLTEEGKKNKEVIKKVNEEIQKFLGKI